MDKAKFTPANITRDHRNNLGKCGEAVVVSLRIESPFFSKFRIMCRANQSRPERPYSMGKRHPYLGDGERTIVVLWVSG